MSVNVHSFDSYTLGPDDDNLVLEGTADVDGTGNDRNNWIVGNSGNNRLFGLGGDDRLDGGSGVDILTGGAGNDIYFVDNVADQVVETSGNGTDTVYSSVSYTLPTNVEALRLLGTANLNATGNALDNLLVGNSGNNVLDGAAGHDELWGGAGNDTYYVYYSFDGVHELANEGIDTVYADSDLYYLPDNVENLVLTSGTPLAHAVGNALDNSIWGTNGRDTIDGGRGADQMFGGPGNDVYIVDNLGDRVFENAGEGRDTVYTSVDFTLPDQVEDLEAGGPGITATGNAMDNQMVDHINGGNVTLYGLGGNDTMRSDFGGDKLFGGDGNDIIYGETYKTWYGETQADALYGEAGDDVIHGGVGNDILMGGDGSDRLYGGKGNNEIDGGSGVDFMDGGIGDDTYFVAQAGDTIRDASGIDTVHASLTYTLGANIENLIIDAASGLAGFGNALDNQMTGGAGDDYLVGMAGNDWIDGGVGRDGMVGGAGDDTYVVNQVGDSVVEALNEGTDTVRSAVGYTLGNNVENLILTGSGNINGVGNALANTLTGNSGNNHLTGGDGADIFLFHADALGQDTITDFSPSQNDTIEVSGIGSAIVVQNGADVMVDLGGGNIITVLNATQAAVQSHLEFV